MEWYWVTLLMIGMIVGLMALGLPVMFAFLAADLIGVILFMGGKFGIIQLVRNAVDSVTTFTLLPVPLFLVMGELFFHTGIGMRVFNALDKFLGNVQARLSYLTVIGGTLFAALSGSSMANTAMLGSLMVPEMSRRGYKSYIAIGPIMGTGSLAMLIPPSNLAVLLGSLGRIDIGALLIAGVLPGVILALFYAAMIGIQIRLDPKAAPAYPIEPVPARERLRLLVTDVLPMGFVMVMVTGVIFFGIATPTEAAAFGVAGVLIIAAAWRRLTLDALVKSLSGALKVTVMTFVIIAGSSAFSQILAFTGASAGLVTWSLSFGADPLLVMVAMFAVLFVLGMFMDQLSMMLLTIPIFVPLAAAYHFDLVWFGIIILLALEIGFTTPPFGLLLFIMKGVAPPGTTMLQIINAALPYIGCVMLLVVLIVAVPDVALLLPRLAGLTQ